MRQGSPRRPLPVWIVMFPDVQVLDVTGPLEVFALANRLSSGSAPRYQISVLAAEAGAVSTSSGLSLLAGRSLRQATGPVDTLLIAGGQGTRAAMRDARLVSWLRRTAPRARRVASVCSGAFLLGEAGLLDGRRVTTHWAVCDALQRRYPTARVEADPIFVRDGRISTSAGVTAGMDLALELVEEDGGRDLALAVARWLVMFLRRPRGQSQFSVQLRAQVAERRGLRDVQAWIAEHLGDDLSVPALARRARMSPRNFARAFRREIGATPAAYVEAQRVEGARRLLETADLSVAEVAAACGFGRVETMHRAFRRGVRVSPDQYRRHFRAAS
ncbi:MAG TPA: GlxA family transcriptional regulator [Methylomirabilota bacterium]|nr:GlxA family transcriptional regulator [Methylomirabilota bacterium]